MPSVASGSSVLLVVGMGIFYGSDHFESLLIDLILFFTTTYTTIPYFGTTFWKAVQISAG